MNLLKKHTWKHVCLLVLLDQLWRFCLWHCSREATRPKRINPVIYNFLTLYLLPGLISQQMITDYFFDKGKFGENRQQVKIKSTSLEKDRILDKWRDILFHVPMTQLCRCPLNTSLPVIFSKSSIRRIYCSCFTKILCTKKKLLHNWTSEIVNTFLKYFVCYVTKRFLPQPLNVEVKTNKYKDGQRSGTLRDKSRTGFLNSKLSSLSITTEVSLLSNYLLMLKPKT